MRWLVISIMSLLLNLNSQANDSLVNAVVEENSAQVSEAKQNLGETIYQQYCYVCHQAGVAGAPRFEQQEDWNPRLKDKSLEKLTESAIAGLNMMPVKGTCSECSEQDIKSAIEFMLPKS